jgi:hypothetical protein
MPSALVIRRFLDDGLHEAGDVIELTDERLEQLTHQGLVTPAPEPAESSPESGSDPTPEPPRKGRR